MICSPGSADLQENMKLTDEYKRITEQFKDLQSKFRHFEQVDTKKYAQVTGVGLHPPRLALIAFDVSTLLHPP